MSVSTTSAASSVVGRLHRHFDHAAGLDEAVLDAGEGLALARLDVFGLGDDARFVVDQDLHAGLDVVHAIAGHGCSCWAAPRAARMMGSGFRQRGDRPLAGLVKLQTDMIPAASPDLQPGGASPARRPSAPNRRGDWQRCGARRSAIRASCCRCSVWSVRCRVSDAAAVQFPLRVPRGFVARMRHGDPARPAAAPGAAARRRDAAGRPASALDAVGDGLPRAGHGRDPQIPGPRTAGRHRQLRGALPLLLPPPLSLRRGNRRGATAGSAAVDAIRADASIDGSASSPAATRCRWPRPSSPN